MGSRENILDPEESYLSPGHPELSLSSGIISLPSANKLEDLSLSSDLTDSEAENEPTVLTSRPCGDYTDGTNDILHREIKNISGDPSNSTMLPHSQRSARSPEKPTVVEENICSRSRDMLPSISKERYMNDAIVSDEEPSRDLCISKNTTQDDAMPRLPTLSLDAVRGTLQQNCNLLSDRHLLKDLLESLEEKIEQESEPDMSVQSLCLGRESKTNIAHEKSTDSDLKNNNNALGMLGEQFPSELSTTLDAKNPLSAYASNTKFDQENHVLINTESSIKSHLDLKEAHTTSRPSQAYLNPKPADQKVLQKLPNHERHVKVQLKTSTAQSSLLEVEGEGGSEKELCSTNESLQVLQ